MPDWTKDSRPTAAELDELPTLAQGQTDNLKWDTGDGVRFWLARTGIEDGEDFEHRCSIETYSNGVGWRTHVDYDGGEIPDEDEPTYLIRRFHFDESHEDHRKVINSGFTLEQAQAHCNDPATSGDGWFDGYEEE